VVKGLEIARRLPDATNTDRELAKFNRIRTIAN